jgi:hypothetical protein
MTRLAFFWFAAGIALAGFVAGTVMHPVSPAAIRSLRASRIAGDSAAAAEQAYVRCAGASGMRKRDCYEKELLPIAAARGPKQALSVLQGLTTRDREVLVFAHEYAHAIGIAAYAADPEVTRTFPECSEIFQSGCYHGVIQAYFVRAGSDDSTAVRGVCAPWTVEGVYGWLRFQCTHGLGHGLTMRLDHDLPEALKRCDLLPDDWDRDSCYGGAFMENIVDFTQPPMAMEMAHAHGVHDASRPKYKQVDSADTAFPCSKLGDRYQTSCWTNQASVIEFLYAGDIPRTASGCALAPAKYARWCFIGLGTDINGRAVGDAEAALKLCGGVSARWREWCYVGVAKNRVEVGAQPETAMVFCRLVTGRAWKNRCYEAVGEEIASVSEKTPDREVMCKATEAPYLQACRFGARIRADRPPDLSAPE